MSDPYQHLRRDNSNLYACEGNSPLWRALRAEKFQKSVPYKDQQFYALTQLHAPETPFEAIDFRLDLETFQRRLPPDLREVFSLFLQGHTPKQIITLTGRSQAAVYRKLQALMARFKTFYQGDGDE